MNILQRGIGKSPRGSVFPSRSDNCCQAFTEVGILPLLFSELDVKLLLRLLLWDQTNDGLKKGTDGGGMVPASICVTSLMLGRASGFGWEHASPNTSKRLMSSSLMFPLSSVAAGRLSAASKSLFSRYSFHTRRNYESISIARSPNRNPNHVPSHYRQVWVLGGSIPRHLRSRKSMEAQGP